MGSFTGEGIGGLPFIKVIWVDEWIFGAGNPPYSLTARPIRKGQINKTLSHLEERPSRVR